MHELTWPLQLSLRRTANPVQRMTDLPQSEALTDEVLAARVQATGDLDAFSLLVTRYRVRLTGLARRMLIGAGAGGPEEAEDVAQEVFLAAYDKRVTFRRDQPFRPWLYRIAVNRCLDRLRAQARRPSMTDLEDNPELAGAGDDPLGALLAEERDVRLQAAVAELPPKHRAVFLLRHLDELSYEEIAGSDQSAAGNRQNPFISCPCPVAPGTDGIFRTMNCREAETLIQQSLDQTLMPEERQRLEAHFQRCPSCRQAWNEYRQLTQATSVWIKQALADDPGDAFTQRVLAQAAACSASTVSPGQTQNRLWSSLAWVTALIGLTVVLTMYVWPGTLSFPTAGWHLPSGQTLMNVPRWLWQKPARSAAGCPDGDPVRDGYFRGTSLDIDCSAGRLAGQWSAGRTCFAGTSGAHCPMTAFLRLLLPLVLLFLGMPSLAAPPLNGPSGSSQAAPPGVAAVQAARLFFGGPAIVVLFISVLAILALLAVGLRFSDPLFRLGLGASERLENRRLLPILWGLAFGVLIVALTGVFFGQHITALLGLIALVGGICLVALGLAAAALNFGREFSQGADGADPDTLTSLRLGLTAFFFASFVPVVGWIIVLLYAAAGTGVVLETLFSRRAP